IVLTQADHAGGGVIQAEKETCYRGLAAPRAPQEAQYPSRLQPESYVSQHHFLVAVAERDIIELDRVCALLVGDTRAALDFGLDAEKLAHAPYARTRFLQVF